MSLQIQAPLLGRGWGRLRKLAHPSLGEGPGVGMTCYEVNIKLEPLPSLVREQKRLSILSFWKVLLYLFTILFSILMPDARVWAALLKTISPCFA